MDLQLRLEEICSDKFFCGAFVSLRRVTFPLTANRCCSDSTRTSKSYLVKVKASRSRAVAELYRPQRRERTQRNFMQAFVGVDGQSHRALPLPPPTHSTTGRSRA